MTAGFLKKCGHRPKQGITRKWYGNISDIDRTATTIVADGTLVQSLILKTGTTVFKIEGDSKSLKNKHALAVLDHDNGYVHTDMFIIPYHGPNEKQRVQKLAQGARVFSIVERLDSGINGENTYEIFGLESGMTIVEDNYDSAANGGVVSITVATNKGEEESTGKKAFLVGSADDTLAWIDANTFAQTV
jgi:hypothetical protein